MLSVPHTRGFVFKTPQPVYYIPTTIYKQHPPGYATLSTSASNICALVTKMEIETLAGETHDETKIDPHNLTPGDSHGGGSMGDADEHEDLMTDSIVSLMILLKSC
jgi:hypothetical protein